MSSPVITHYPQVALDLFREGKVDAIYWTKRGNEDYAWKCIKNSEVPPERHCIARCTHPAEDDAADEPNMPPVGSESTPHATRATNGATTPGTLKRFLKRL